MHPTSRSAQQERHNMTNGSTLRGRLGAWFRTPRTLRSSGRKRLVLAGGGLVLAASVATLASFTDVANLNLGNGADGSGIGNPEKFDLAVVLPDGTVEQADTDAGYNWEVPGAETLIPGGTIATTIPIFNNSARIDASIAVSLVLLNGDGSVAERPNITQFLRFSATRDGVELFAERPWSEAQGEFGILSARDADPLNPGDPFTEGATNSAGSLELTIDYLDLPETENFNGGQSAFRVHFGAESTQQ